MASTIATILLASMMIAAVMAKAIDTDHVLVKEQDTVPVERRVDDALHQTLARAMQDAANILKTSVLPNQSSEPST